VNANLSINCPNCETPISITKALAQQIDQQIEEAAGQKLQAERESLSRDVREKTEKEFSGRLNAADLRVKGYQSKLAQAEQAELEARQQREETAREKRNLELTIARRLDEERGKLRQQAIAEEQERSKAELADRDRNLAEKDAKLREAEAAELTLRRERLALADEKRALEVEIERRVDGECQKVREATLQQEEENHRLKLAEKDKVIEDMRKQAEELRRKSDQGSQQLQGEVQEVELEALLRNAFPGDLIDPIPNGRSGGDILQQVIAPNGVLCGTILWESKRTRNWNDDWLAKNREDQRTTKAHLGVVVTATMPKGVDTFTRLEGVWVTNLHCALPLATALRHALAEKALAQMAGQGRDTKMERLYGYVTGQEFRQWVSAIVEGYLDMRNDLDAERRAAARQFAKRDRHLDLVITSLAGIHGSLLGIVGKSMPEIAGLNVPLLESPEPAEAQAETVVPQAN
jgi:hypothetical protein